MKHDNLIKARYVFTSLKLCDYDAENEFSSTAKEDLTENIFIVPVMDNSRTFHADDATNNDPMCPV